MNLLAADGLRGSEHLNLLGELQRLDGLARKVEWETERNLHQINERPEEFDHSEAQFRMMALTTVLQQDLGIQYNPDRATMPGVFESNDNFYADSRDVFIHGLLGERRMGTCSSLPVLYVAVGRRLGYPLELVPAKNHLFVRWEDGNDRFNMDATGFGFNTFSDEHYREWPLPINERELERFEYLKSMTPFEELATFMSMRGHALMVAGRLNEAIAAHESAMRLDPDSALLTAVLEMARDDARRRTQRALPMPTDPNIRALMIGMSPEEREMEAAVWRAEQVSRRNRGE